MPNSIFYPTLICTMFKMTIQFDSFNNILFTNLRQQTILSKKNQFNGSVTLNE